MSEAPRDNAVPTKGLRALDKPKKTPLDPALAAQRNLAIFKKVEIEKLPQKAVAELFKLRRSRVTQIVNQVRRDLALARADDPQIDCHLARQRLRRELEKLRLEYALDAAAEAMRRDTPHLVTNRQGSRNKDGSEEGWNETITRDKPPNVQLIKTFMRLTRELGQLNEREIANNPVPDNVNDFDLFTKIGNVLRQWVRSLHLQKDPPSDALKELVEQFVVETDRWIFWRKQGVSSAQAWPYDPCAQGRESGEEAAE